MARAPGIHVKVTGAWLSPGDAAHFLIGRDAATGLIQLAPVTNNANHAGGSGHGNFVAGAQKWHPNSVSVGIEVHCAGAVQQVNGDWHLIEGGVAQGDLFPRKMSFQTRSAPEGAGTRLPTGSTINCKNCLSGSRPCWTPCPTDVSPNP